MALTATCADGLGLNDSNIFHYLTLDQVDICLSQLLLIHLHALLREVVCDFSRALVCIMQVLLHIVVTVNHSRR